MLLCNFERSIPNKYLQTCKKKIPLYAKFHQHRKTKDRMEAIFLNVYFCAFTTFRNYIPASLVVVYCPVLFRYKSKFSSKLLSSSAYSHFPKCFALLPSATVLVDFWFLLIAPFCKCFVEWLPGDECKIVHLYTMCSGFLIITI